MPGATANLVCACLSVCLQLGAALSPLTSLRSVRLDASEYGVVVETEEQLPIDTQLAYNQALRPITALQNLESLAMVRAHVRQHA